jgi:hypothetical protein
MDGDGNCLLKKSHLPIDLNVYAFEHSEFYLELKVKFVFICVYIYKYLCTYIYIYLFICILI